MDDFNASAASAAASATMGGGLPTVEVKSKFDAEFRRFSLDGSAHRSFEEFRALVGRLHGLDGNGPGAADDFRISYVDSKDNDLLPINNTDNYQVSCTWQPFWHLGTYSLECELLRSSLSIPWQ